MAIDDILKAIEEEAQETIAEIKERAHLQAEEIIAEARERASSVTEEVVEREKEKIASETAEILNAARIKARKIVSEAIEEAIESVFKNLEQRLTALEGAERQKLMRRLLAEVAAVYTNSHRPIVRVSERDIETARSLANEIGFSATFEGDGNLEGGLVARDSDETLLIDATLGTIAEKVRNEFRTEVYRELFGNR
jgi:vacuolar-type H+-ATPase subunit E/Vma4